MLYLAHISSVSAESDLTRWQNRADSLSLSDGILSINICDSILANKSLSNLARGVFLRIKGKADYFMGNYKEAAISLDQSVKSLSKENNKIPLGVTLIEQAKLYRKLKMYEQAIETYQHAASIFEKNKDNTHLATVWNEWGVVYEAKNEYERAIGLYNQSLKLKSKIKDTVGMAYANSFLYGAYLKLGNDRIAGSYAQSAFELFQKINMPFQLAYMSTNLAELYIQKKDLQGAIKRLNYSDSIASGMNFKDLRAQNYFNLSRIYALMSNYKRAFEYEQAYASLKDSLFQESSQQTVANLNIQYKTAQKDKFILEQKNKLLHQRWLLGFFVFLAFIIGLAAFFIARVRRLRELRILQEAKLKESLLKLEAQNNLHKERLRISRDLHDNLGSYLTFISSTINSQHPQMEPLKQITKDAISELRRTVWLISKSAVTLEEFGAKVREYFLRGEKIKVHIHFDDALRTIDAKLAKGIFRIIQEAINNSIKYSESQHIQIEVLSEQEQLTLSIQDDGKGFDFSTIKKGNGLENMKYRAEELGGIYNIKSRVNLGTKIDVAFSLKK